MDLMNGYLIYRRYSGRRAYYRDVRRRKRDLYMIEHRFSDVLKPDKRTVLTSHVKIQQAFNDLLTCLNLEPEVLLKLKNILGNSLSDIHSLSLNDFSLKEGTNATLFYIILNLLVNKYDESAHLNKELSTSVQQISYLNDSLLSLQSENVQLLDYILEIEDSHINKITEASLKYQNLLDNYNNLQHDHQVLQITVIHLTQKLTKTESDLTMQHIINKTHSPKFESLPIDLEYDNDASGGSPRTKTIFHRDGTDFDTIVSSQTPTFGDVLMDNFDQKHSGLLDSRFENSENYADELRNTRRNGYLGTDTNTEEVMELRNKLNNYRNENEMLRDELKRLNDRNEILKFTSLTERITNVIEGLVKCNTLLPHQIPCLLLVENEFYKSLYNDLSKELNIELAERYRLQVNLLQLNVKLNNAQQVFYKLENQSVLLMNNEEELKLLKSNNEVYTDQMLKLQAAAISLNEEKHDLQMEINTLRSMNDTSLKECDVLRDEVRKMEKLLEYEYNNNNSNFGIRDRVLNIHLEGTCKLLEDKLIRSRNDVESMHNTNLHLISSITELKNSLTQMSHEHNLMSKQLISSNELNSRLHSQVENLNGEIESYKSSLEMNNDVLTSTKRELEQAKERMMEFDLREKKLFELIKIFKTQFDVLKGVKYPQLNEYLRVLNALMGMNDINNPEEQDSIDTIYIILTTILKCNTVLVNLTRSFIEGGSTGVYLQHLSSSTVVDERKVQKVTDDDFLDAISVPNEGSPRQLPADHRDALVSRESEDEKKTDISSEFLDRNSLKDGESNHQNNTLIAENGPYSSRRSAMGNISEVISLTDCYSRLDISSLRLIYTTEIERMGNYIMALESLDKNSLMSEINESYQLMVERYKLELMEMKKLHNATESALKTLEEEKEKLLDDCTRAANAILDYERRTSAFLDERLKIKDIIITILPSPIKDACDLNNTIQTLQTLASFMKEDRKLKQNDAQRADDRALNINDTNYPPDKNGVENVVIFDDGVHEANDLSVPKDTSVFNSFTLVPSNDQEPRSSSNAKGIEISSQQLRDLVSNIIYYYRAIKDNIEDQLRDLDAADAETDYESPRDFTTKSDDTIDDEDEDMTNLDEINEKYIKYFEFILDLLDKLRNAKHSLATFNSISHHTLDPFSPHRDRLQFEPLYNDYLPTSRDRLQSQHHTKQRSSNEFSVVASNVSRDVVVIEKVVEMSKVLREFLIDTPKQLHLDELIYQFESLPTSTEPLDIKNQKWIKCLSSIISIATDVLYFGIKQQNGTLEEAIMKLKVTSASLAEKQELTNIQSQELERRSIEIDRLETKVRELQSQCSNLQEQLEHGRTENYKRLEEVNIEKDKIIRQYQNQIKKLEKLIVELEQVNTLLNRRGGL